MRRYDDPVHVRPQIDGGSEIDGLGAPGQFVWRGRLYVVRAVLAHWVEVGAWWRVRDADGLPVAAHSTGRQMWRVEARSGRGPAHGGSDGSSGGSSSRSFTRAPDSFVGVYDLAYDEAAGPTAWRLARALD